MGTPAASDCATTMRALWCSCCARVGSAAWPLCDAVRPFGRERRRRSRMWMANGGFGPFRVLGRAFLPPPVRGGCSALQQRAAIVVDAACTHGAPLLHPLPPPTPFLVIGVPASCARASLPLTHPLAV